jgi:hypothetical protein
MRRDEKKGRWEIPLVGEHLNFLVVTSDSVKEQLGTRCTFVVNTAYTGD